MNRPTIRVTVTDGETIVHDETRHAWNAGIRASEQAMREIARAERSPYEGGRPEASRVNRYDPTPGDVYRRVWVADKGGRVLVATVTVEG